MKTAIVTGATSFLASTLIRDLLKSEYNVIAIVRKNSNNMYRLDGLTNIQIIELNLSDIENLPQLVSGGDIFFHFAWDGAGSAGRQNKQVQYQNYLDSMKAVKAAGEIHCKTFVFAGSQAEYGKCQGRIVEEQHCEPVSEYGIQKYQFGKDGFREAQKYCMNFIHMRIFSVYGYWDREGTLIDSCIDTFQNGGEIELGKCTQLWNYLYVDDFTQIAIALAESKEIECKNEIASIFNIGGLECKPLKEFVEDIYHCSIKRGSYIIGKKEENAEGSPSIEPDTSKLFQVIPYKLKYSFQKGIVEIMKKKFGKDCIVCGKCLGKTPLISFENMPASAQNIPNQEELQKDSGIDLHLFQCSKCALIQFDCEPVDYYKDVIRSGGFTTTMTELRRKQYKKLIEKYNLNGKKILEVGCGQGEFLSVLQEFDVQAWGIENRKQLVELAQRKGLNVIEGFITDEDNPAEENGPYAAFLSFNFLEHQPEPNKMLESIYDNLTEDGVGLITVPSFEYIMQYDGYYEFLRDHIAYYTFDSLRFLVNKNGFEVLEEEMINRDTLSIIVRKRKALDLSPISQSYARIKEQFEHFILNCEKENKRIAVWGASHQGFTIAATLKLKDKIEYIVDSAPFKQNKYAPASHIPIISPEKLQENKVEVIVIIAPGYTDEIHDRILELYGECPVEIYTLRTNQIEKM